MFKFYRLIKILKTLGVYGFYVLIGKKTKAMHSIFYGFSEIGGLYVKFLQLMVLRGDFNEVNVGNLTDSLAVFDQNTYEKIDIRRKLRSDLGQQAHEIIVLDEQPIAAGSFGQVYKAKLADSTDVAIKILRPSVTKYLLFDLMLIGLVSRVISISKPDAFLDAKTVFSDFKQITINETNYIAEAKTAEKARARLHNHQVIGIPKTFLPLCSRHILVQEFVSGTALSEIMEITTPETIRQYVQDNYNTDLGVIIEEMAYDILEAVLNDEGAHGDPHPGNIYIQNNNHVALIDFGITTDPIHRKQEMLGLVKAYVSFYDGTFMPEQFMINMMNFLVPRLTQSLSVVGRASGINISDKVLNMLGDIVGDEIRNQPENARIQQILNDYRVASLFVEVINSGNRFGIKAEIESLAFLRGSVMFLNLSDKLGVKRTSVGSAYKRILHDYKDVSTTYNIDYGAQSLDQSYHFIASWMDKLRYNDPISYNKLAKVLR